MIVSGLLGVALGAATGVPLGVVNLSVVEAAARAGRAHAMAIGIGGAIADTIHAGLAFAGIAPALEDRPEVMRGLAIASAAIVIAYAIVIFRGRARPIHVKPGRGVVLGLLLTLPNPAPLAAWIAVASALLPHAPVEDGVAAALGVGVGSAAWFAFLAHVAARGAQSALITRWLPRAIAIVFAAIAVLAIVRSFWI